MSNLSFSGITKNLFKKDKFSLSLFVSVGSPTNSSMIKIHGSSEDDSISLSIVSYEYLLLQYFDFSLNEKETISFHLNNYSLVLELFEKIIKIIKSKGIFIKGKKTGRYKVNKESENYEIIKISNNRNKSIAACPFVSEENEKGILLLLNNSKFKIFLTITELKSLYLTLKNLDIIGSSLSMTNFLQKINIKRKNEKPSFQEKIIERNKWGNKNEKEEE